MNKTKNKPSKELCLTSLMESLLGGFDGKLFRKLFFSFLFFTLACTSVQAFGITGEGNNSLILGTENILPLGDVEEEISKPAVKPVSEIPKDIITSQGFQIPKNKGQFILDQANLFSDTQEKKLLTQVQNIEKETSVEIAVFTFLNLNGEDISQLAVEVGRAWGVGKKENDNGILILIAKNNRKWFIATGYGVEGVLPDVLAGRIGRKHFPVNFRKGDYFSGVSLVISDIKGLLEHDSTVVVKYKNKERSQYIGFVIFLMFIFSIFGRMWVQSTDIPKEKGIKALLLSSIFGVSAYMIVLIIPVTFIFMFFLFLSLISDNTGGGSSHFGGSGGFGGFGGGGGSFGGGSFGGGGGGGSW